MVLMILKNIFKLMINSVYGKTMEHLQKRKGFLEYTSKPTYITPKIFDNDYAAIHEIKPVLIFNKPIYVEFTVPDLSKWKVYYCLLTQTALLRK